MIVVADSSPIVALINVDQIAILPQLFGRVIAPEEVRLELAASRRPPVVQAFAAVPPVWLEIRKPQHVQAIPRLHAGEVAAISLASELKADLLLMDETDGRREAVQRQLRVTGTVGLLERAADEGLLNLRDAFNKLKATDFWISEALLDHRLHAFELRAGRSVQRRPQP